MHNLIEKTFPNKNHPTLLPRSDYDVLLDAASDYETNIQYIDRIMEVCTIWINSNQLRSSVYYNLFHVAFDDHNPQTNK